MYSIVCEICTYCTVYIVSYMISVHIIYTDSDANMLVLYYYMYSLTICVQSVLYVYTCIFCSYCMFLKFLITVCKNVLFQFVKMYVYSHDIYLISIISYAKLNYSEIYVENVVVKMYYFSL